MVFLRSAFFIFQGVLFSLNAQESLEEYVSLEIRKGKLMLVHFDHKSSSSSGNNGKVGSRIIDIPATNLADGRWHSVAIRCVKLEYLIYLFSKEFLKQAFFSPIFAKLKAN